MLTEFHVGIDDTDSTSGGCTTYTAAVLFKELCDKGFRPLDFPWLVRLNPNIPWKTRGNGALSIHFLISDDMIDEAKKITFKVISETTDISARGADPAVAFLQGQTPPILQKYSLRALHEVLSVPEAKRIAKTVNAKVHLLRGTRGIIGSLAAIGAQLDTIDHTFEIIAYRMKENLGKPRCVDHESVREMDAQYRGGTFQNLDPETGRILVCPHGPDPVLLGIRGGRPDILLEAFRKVRIGETVERIMIFRTNQGTDAHIRVSKWIAELRPYQSAVVSGLVETSPRILRGGHVLFLVGDETGRVDCMAYAPTGSMMKVARELIPGDKVRLSGGLREGKERLSLNLEKIEIMELSDASTTENPLCPICGGRCESMGRAQGFRCKHCNSRHRNLVKERVGLVRQVATSIYIPSPRARRHLTKPDHLHDEGAGPMGSTGFSYDELIRDLGTRISTTG